MTIDCSPENLSVRYRYPNEDWIEIDGDDYSIEESQNLNSGRVYRVKGKGTLARNYSRRYCNYYYWNHFSEGSGNDGVFNSIKTYYVHGPIYNWRNANYNTVGRCDNHFKTIPALKGVTIEGYSNIEILCHGSASNCDDLANKTEEPIWVTYFAAYRAVFINGGYERLEFFPCGDLPSTCTFTVYKDGEIVHEEARDVCPEAEYLCKEISCPSGTCECRKDNLVCCYNPRTGYVVKSFRL